MVATVICMVTTICIVGFLAAQKTIQMSVDSIMLTAYAELWQKVCPRSELKFHTEASWKNEISNVSVLWFYLKLHISYVEIGLHPVGQARNQFSFQ